LPINDYTNLQDIRKLVQLKLFKQAYEQYKTKLGEKDFRIGDIVRVKLISYAEDKHLHTLANNREKQDLFRKFNVINYTLYRFRIRKVFASKIRNYTQFELLQNTMPINELEAELRKRYELDIEYEPNVFTPYILENKNHNWFSPKFYSSELQLVPPNSTGYSITPSTQRVKYLNTYAYRRPLNNLNN